MPSILVVEDEGSIAMGLKGDLELEGYEVEVAEDGLQAYEMALEGGYDLLLLDLMLPGKDGFEVCRELRKEGCEVPIIMLTARTQEAEKVLGLELGADDYITKPFSPMELRARIKAVLRRTGGEDPSHYRFDGLEVDLKRFEVCRDGSTVRLTPLEFKLLAAFVRNPGQVLSRDRILDLVWGRDAFVTDRVVDTHITNLRKKIEPEPADPRFIVTVKGVGYRFDG